MQVDVREASEAAREAVSAPRPPVKSLWAGIPLMVAWTVGVMVLLPGILQVVAWVAGRAFGVEKGSFAGNALPFAVALVGILVLVGVLLATGVIQRATAYLVREGAAQQARGVMIAVLLLAAIYAVFGLVWQPDTEWGRVSAEMNAIPSPASIILGLLLGATAGLSEELWRFLSMWLLGARQRPVLAVLLTTVVFGSFHIVGADPTSLAGVLRITNSLVMGLLFGSLMVLGVSLWRLALLHGLWDAILTFTMDPTVSFEEALKRMSDATPELLDYVFILIHFPIVLAFAAVAWRMMLRAHRAEAVGAGAASPT